MPHITLQQSNNVTNHTARVFFKHVHQLLAQKLPTKLESCTSRLIVANDYLVADGKADLAFAHLEVAIYAGRSSALLIQVTQDLYNLLYEHLTPDNIGLNIHITVEVRILSEYYSKG